MKRRALLVSAAQALAAGACAQLAPVSAERTNSATRVDTLLSRMSLEERVGQLVSVAFHGRRITPHLESLVRARRIGGVILFKENFDDAPSLRALIGDLAQLAKEAGSLPLFFAIDQEGGAVVRIGRGATVVPSQMALAATPDPATSVRRAVDVTVTELRAIGINWNFAPVADVQDEPANPIILNRAFGSDAAKASSLTTVAIRAYTDAGFLCCAKHFPGHGAAAVDSHVGLPTIAAPLAKIESVELAPFRAAIAAGVPAIMSAHIHVPALDPTEGLPATLSRRVMTDLLRTRMAFDGICVTDDLEMGALRELGGIEQVAVRAVEAGADYLLFRFDERAQLEAHRLLVAAVGSGTLRKEIIEASVRRLLAAKDRFGVLDQSARSGAIGTDAGRATALDLARQSITLLRARDGVLPLRGRVLVLAPAEPDIAVIEDQPTLGDVLASVRPDVVARTMRAGGARASASDIADAVAAARAADVVVVGTSERAHVEIANAVQAVRPTVVASLRSPYDLAATPSAAAHLCVYQGREPGLRAAAEVLTGARKPVGRLPLAIPPLYAVGAGMSDLS